MDRLETRKALFCTHDFAQRELKRRFDCAAKYQRESRQKRALEHRELMASVASMSVQREPEQLPYWLRRYYSTQFMTEDWLTHPQYIDCDNWLLTPRPLGQRCLLVASLGLTVAITKQGELHRHFRSALPNGGKGTEQANIYSVMEAVYSEEAGAYFVLDVLTWNGVALYEHPAEYRLLLSRQYVKEAATTPSDIPLLSAPVYKCSPEAIQTVYSAVYTFRTDGLLFYRDSGEYILGINPEVLLWKDANCSPYPVDEGERQLVTLHLGTHGRLLTLDKVLLHTLSPALIADKALHPGMLITLSCDGLDLESLEPTLLNPQFMRISRKSKLRADHWSRILYQSIARKGGIPLSELLQAAGSPQTVDWDVVSPVLYVSKGRIGVERKAAGGTSMDVD